MSAPLPFDFNVHLVPSAGSTDERILSDTAISVAQSVECYEKLRPIATGLLSGANIMLFNQSWTNSPSYMHRVSELSRADFGENVCFTQLIDFRVLPDRSALSDARALGLRGMKFHCYVQEIREQDWPEILTWAVVAQEMGLFICIDASFGTAGMYDYDNLRLAAWLAKRIEHAPIILLHSGGLRAMEAFLLAESCANVWLETSFSVPYYQGTRVQNDLGAVYRRMSGRRILYASDHPYIAMDASLDAFRAFAAAESIPASELGSIMCGNALGLLETCA
jgi:hypothetical protein